MLSNKITIGENPTLLRQNLQKNQRQVKKLNSKAESLEEKLINHKDLVIVEMTLPPTKVKEKEVIPFKKNDKLNKFQLKEYQRHNLTIPELPKVRMPVDISKNIIENKKLPEMKGLNIQSDEFVDVNINSEMNKNTNNPYYNKIKADNDKEFNLYLERNTKTYVGDTFDIDNTSDFNTKNYIQQKKGKDASTQINDGDIFNFDNDVEPLLTVITNKILEQSQLELMEEYEISKLKETKNKYYKKNLDEKGRVKDVEHEEINRKKVIDNLKKVKLMDKNNSKTIQQKLISRVTSKIYLKDFFANSIKGLSSGNVFCNFNNTTNKDFYIKKISGATRRMSTIDMTLDVFIDNMTTFPIENSLDKHKNFLEERKERLLKIKNEEEIKKKEFEEEEKIRKIEKEKKKNVKRIKKLRNDIKENIIKIAQVKGEFHTEDYIFSPNSNETFERSTFNEDIGSFVSIFGGLLGQFVISLKVFKFDIFQLNDGYFTSDCINELLLSILSESGRLILRFKSTCDEQIRKVLNMKTQNNNDISKSNNSYEGDNDLSDFDIHKLKENTTLSKEDWNKISDILCKFEYCAEEYLIHSVTCLQESKEETNQRLAKEIKASYEIIVKSLIILIEKGNEKIFTNFSKPILDIEEYFNKHFDQKAFVLITPSDNYVDMLENAEYIKDKRYKKLKTPIIDTEAKRARVYTPSVSHISPINQVDYGYKVLFQDVNAEFFISLKFFEWFLKTIITKYEPDIECKSIYVKFTECFLKVNKTLRDTMEYQKRILYYEIPIFEELEKEIIEEN